MRQAPTRHCAEVRFMPAWCAWELRGLATQLMVRMMANQFPDTAIFGLQFAGLVR